jgi:ribonucleotide reductase alpha subunit
MFRSNKNPMFRSQFSETIFNQKYAHEGCEDWASLCVVLVNDVCGDYMSKSEKDALIRAMQELKFIPGGRYLYYAGRERKFYNNCLLLKAEADTREDWAELSWKAERSLMTGAGIGVDYSVYRAEGVPLKTSGGLASGPIPKIQMLNEIGRRVMQGGSRRSAIYASLNWQHGDIIKFIESKDWHKMPIPGTDKTIWDAKQADFNYPAPLDMTNISVNYDTDWLLNYWNTGEIGDVFRRNVLQALSTGEPGFSFNFFDKERETLRNAPVSADTWVLTDEGYQQVREIVDVPATVWTGKRWAPTTFRKTKEQTPTVVVAMTGGRKITCDPVHEFLVERYEGRGKARKMVGIERIPAGDLEPGDVLHLGDVPAIESTFDNTWYWRGYNYGDGSFNNRYGCADVTFCCQEKAALVPALPTDVTINPSDSRGYTRAYFKDDFYRTAQKAVFPDVPLTYIASFIAGLFDADGSYDATQHRFRLASVEYGFLEGVRRALEALGIHAGINGGTSLGYGERPCYLLVVMGSSVSRFTEIIPTKRVIGEGYTPYRASTIKVVSVSDGPTEDVFCCDVKYAEHSFMAEGVIISNCTEVTSADDSDVCNLGSVNLGRVEDIFEFTEIVELATKFLLCGTMVADLPYEKVGKVREKNRRLGLGLMGIHEWLLKRRSRYEVTPDLHRWLAVYKGVSDDTAAKFADECSVSRPVARRAIAPTGTIGILAGTTTGIEPVFAVAYKRRFLKGKAWHYQYVVDSAAQELISLYGLKPSTVESAVDLASDYERRIKFQAEVQAYVDQSISSTINLPPWGSSVNNADMVSDFANTLAKYAHRLRGFTVYPDGSRGGQPLVSVPYSEAVKHLGKTFEEHVETHDICSITNRGGSCGV